MPSTVFTNKYAVFYAENMQINHGNISIELNNAQTNDDILIRLDDTKYLKYIMSNKIKKKLANPNHKYMFYIINKYFYENEHNLEKYVHLLKVHDKDKAMFLAGINKEEHQYFIEWMEWIKNKIISKNKGGTKWIHKYKKYKNKYIMAKLNHYKN